MPVLHWSVMAVNIPWLIVVPECFSCPLNYQRDFYLKNAMMINLVKYPGS